MMGEFFRKLGKMLFAGFIGAAVGVAVSLFYFIVVWLPLKLYAMGFSVIVLTPLLAVLFSVLGAVAGLILGVIFYWILKFTRRKDD